MKLWPTDANHIASRFWAKVAVGAPDECWPWLADTNDDGYGIFRLGPLFERHSIPAHVQAWEMHNGPMPSGVKGCHTCDNPPCCNPRHVYPGSPQSNMDDKVNRDRQTRGEQINTAKLTTADVLEIRRLYRGRSTPQVVIAAQFGVDRSQISAIVRRRTWKHVN